MNRSYTKKKLYGGASSHKERATRCPIYIYMCAHTYASHKSTAKLSTYCAGTGKRGNTIYIYIYVVQSMCEQRRRRRPGKKLIEKKK